MFIILRLGVVWCGVVWCGVVWCGVYINIRDIPVTHSDCTDICKPLVRIANRAAVTVNSCYQASNEKLI